MRILLVQAYLGKQRPEETVFPLGLASLAGVLSNHEVAIFDPNTSDSPMEDLEQRISDFNPQVVGVSLRNIDSNNTKPIIYYFDLLPPMIKLIKEHKTRPTVIIGGAGFSLFPEKIMERVPEIDVGVYLEAEESFPELLGNLERPEAVGGIFYRKEGRVHFTGPREEPDFSSLPPPRWDLLDLSHYSKACITTSVGIQTKRGCGFNCAYCTYRYLSGGKARLYPPDKVVDEIERLVNTYRVKNIFFADSIFNLPLSHAETICREMIHRGIEVSWGAYFDMKHINEDFVRLAVKAGCKVFDFSPDGYTEKVLGLLCKNLTRQDIINCLEVCRKVPGFRFHLNFFLDPPGQDLLSFLRLYLFLIKTKLQFKGRLLGSLGLTRIRIEPNTGLEEIALSEGVIDRDTDLLYPVLYANPAAARIRFIYSAMRAIRNLAASLSGRKRNI